MSQRSGGFRVQVQRMRRKIARLRSSGIAHARAQLGLRRNPSPLKTSAPKAARKARLSAGSSATSDRRCNQIAVVDEEAVEVYFSVCDVRMDRIVL